MGRLNQKVAETANFLTLLVSRDTRWFFYRLARRGAGHAMEF